ncbi:hypothetical protein AYK25_09795 [Thermoplasmatales archaeon SM1-50]|nr:MAG: hypothetical protein AYK25_09795 [Thermoplasmatales archaeon SM1-50]
MQGIEIISDPHLFTVYELKKAFIVGRYTNLTEEDEYVTIEAFNLWIIFFNLLLFFHYTDGETVILFYDTIRLMSIPQLVMDLTDLVS